MNYVVQTDVTDRMVVVLNGGAGIGESNVDEDSADSDCQLMTMSSRLAVFKQAEEVVAKVVRQIEASQEICAKSGNAGKSVDR